MVVPRLRRAVAVVCGLLLIGSAVPSVASSGVALALAQSDELLDQDAPAQKRADLTRAAANHDVSPDRLVVVYRRASGVNDPERQLVRRQAGGQVLQASRGLQSDVLRVPNGSADSLARVLRGLPAVKDAYPDRLAHADVQVNDPLLASEWALTTIHAAQAWDVAQGTGVLVAVLDCGIHVAHPDLAGKVASEQNFTAEVSTDDVCNHGTHVAGTIAAVTNNGLGVAGVAPGARLLNGKVLGDSGVGYFSDIERGIQWAADNGARVINLSLSADVACLASTQNAVDYAWSHGAVVVAAAGNTGSLTSAGAPANCSNVIGVGATDAGDVGASWSNGGLGVAVAAPGVSILSTVNPNDNAGSLYAPMSGTSMASPHAAGVAALLASSGFGSSPASIRDRLFSTADRIAGTGVSWTYGRINAAAALGAGSSTPAPTGTPTLASTPTATATPTRASTATATSAPTLVNTPTATPGVGGQTVSFDDLTGANRVLSGRYPSGSIDWGTGVWFLAGPWGQFQTNSVSFNGSGHTSAAFTFVVPQVLVRVDAFNGGTTSSTLTLSCAGQPTVQSVLAANHLQTIATGWQGACTSVTVGSSNGWDTNFDNVVIAAGGGTPAPTSTATPLATATHVPQPTSTATTPPATSTATPQATRTATALPTSTATPLATGTPTGVPLTVGFDDLANPDRRLTGQYPTGIIAWGTGDWYLAGPWGKFTTNSLSFSGPSLTSATLTFVTPRRLVRLDAYNGGTTSSTVTLTCSGQPTVSATLAAGQLLTLLTNWTTACPSVTVSSTNSWNTNFDNLVVQ